MTLVPECSSGRRPHSSVEKPLYTQRNQIQVSLTAPRDFPDRHTMADHVAPGQSGLAAHLADSVDA
jgi:hypothetical protein